MAYMSLDSEPFYWHEGVSTWVTEIIRAITLIFVCGASFYGWKSMHRATKELSGKFFSEEHSVLRFFSSETFVDIGLGKTRPAKFMNIILPVLIDRNKYPVEKDQSSECDLQVKELWQGYLYQDQFSWLRNLAGMIIIFLFALFLAYFFGMPSTPFRGKGFASWWWRDSRVLLFCLVFSFLYLLVYVFDKTRLCKILAKYLADRTCWPDKIRDERRSQWNLKLCEATEKQDGRDPVVDSWLDIEFFADLSEPVAKLIYYPFFALALIILSRSNVFDNWETPVGLYLIFAVCFILAAYAAIRLRLTAEKIRKVNLEVLNGLVIKAKGEDGSDGAEAQLKMLIDRVVGMRRGAFAPFSQQPLLKAVLMALSSGAGVYVLEFFMNYY